MVDCECLSNMCSAGGIRGKAGGMGGALGTRREVPEAHEGMPEHKL
jgi:hypothetical protein